MVRDPETDVIYHSLKLLCKFKGIPYFRVHNYYYRHKVCLADAIKLARKEPDTRKYKDPYTKKPEYLKTIVKNYGEVSEATVHRRLHSGMSLIDALKNYRPDCIDPISHKQFDTFKALCKSYNRDDNTVRSRLRNGWDLVRALTTPVRKHNDN